MSESHPEKKRDTGIDCENPYDRENDCTKCSEPPEGRTQCQSLCTTKERCRRSAMPNVPTCWEHFERYIVDNPQLNQQLRQQVGQVQDRSVRHALERTMKRTIVKSSLQNIIPIKDARTIVEDYSYSKWVTWKYPDETEPLEWKSITHLNLRGSAWPAEFPPNLKELRVSTRTRGATGILKVSDTVTKLEVRALARGVLELPSGIEELHIRKGIEIRITSPDLTEYKKLRKLKLSSGVEFGPGKLQLGPNLEELTFRDYDHQVAPGDMFPEGAENLQSLELGTVLEESMGDAELQKMYTFSNDKFPSLQTLSLYRSNTIRENIELCLPASVTRLVIPAAGRMSNRFFKQFGGNLQELKMDFEYDTGVVLESLDVLPQSLESLWISGIDYGFTVVDLRKLANLSTVRLASGFKFDKRTLPEIHLPPKVSTFYMDGQRIYRWGGDHVSDQGGGD